ncbi:MAG: hypothetical protein H6736_11125 [Alphaproteobacteria bacterium]|nr:hypothetical protein [Alphaproteobacteria bacterium]MCB9692356.1 hypothetical protein [Alphaproteobacteria bacterium]
MSWKATPGMVTRSDRVLPERTRRAAELTRSSLEEDLDVLAGPAAADGVRPLGAAAGALVLARALVVQAGLQIGVRDLDTALGREVGELDTEALAGGLAGDGREEGRARQELGDGGQGEPQNA